VAGFSFQAAGRLAEKSGNIAPHLTALKLEAIDDCPFIAKTVRQQK